MIIQPPEPHRPLDLGEIGSDVALDHYHVDGAYHFVPVPISQIQVWGGDLRPDPRRVIRLMKLMRRAVPLPPLHGHPPGDGAFWKIGDGCHRFYASVALGFLFVPVTQ
jgi:hypothetical protein